MARSNLIPLALVGLSLLVGIFVASRAIMAFEHGSRFSIAR